MVEENLTRRAALGGIVGATAAPYVPAPQLAQNQSAEMIEVQRIFVDLPLTEAEAATPEGLFFELIDRAAGLVEVRRRTSSGSDLLYSKVIASALASIAGDTMIGSDDGQNGAFWSTVAGFIDYIRSAFGAAVVGFVQAGADAVMETMQSAVRRQGVYPEQFGAIGDGEADDLKAIMNAAAAVAANPGCALVFQHKIYAVSDTLDFSSVPVVRARRTLIRPLHNGIAIQYLAPAGSHIRSPRIEGDLKVRWPTYDFTKDRVGFFVQNVYNGYFEVSCSNATRSVRLHANGMGCVYNRFFFNEMHHHNVGVWLSCETVDGWTNSNEFHGGRWFGGGSGSSMEGALFEGQASHIYVDDTNYAHNGNLFVDNSLEWNGEGFKLARMRGALNRLAPRRCEMVGDDVWITDDGHANLIDAENVPYVGGYDPTLGAGQRIDVSGATDPVVRGASGYKGMSGSSQNYETLHATRPAIRGINNGTGPGIAARSVSSAGSTALQVELPDGTPAVEISASGLAWRVKRNTSGTINKQVLWTSSEAPITGTWMRGDIAWATNPEAGGFVGWVCIADGMPGTWKGFGAIEA